MQGNLSPEREDKTLTRRELLKALTAAGGAMTLGAFLPDRWTKPVVGVGVLPAHAQGTCPYELEILSAFVAPTTWGAQVRTEPCGVPPIRPYDFRVFWGEQEVATTGISWFSGECRAIIWFPRPLGTISWELTIVGIYSDTCQPSDTTTVTPPNG